MLATKLFVPSLRQSLVARSRLAEGLDGSLTDDHRLTLVSAPAGFGKTTLLGAWLDSLATRKDDIGVGWVSLDEGDNDLQRLLGHIAAAFAGRGLDIDLPALESRESPGGTLILTALVNEIVRAGEQTPEKRWLLVLDDYHVIDAPAVHEAVTFLLDRLPSKLHLVIATRSDPPLPLARLRSRGQLVELRADDLRFTDSEAGEFLNRVMGLDLTTGDVKALEDRTEGWIAGLQLAALSLRSLPGRDETTGFIASFTGSHRFVIDYLVDEVLARLPAATQQFLLRTSLLDRLTGPLCDEVTGGSGGAAVLERLERENLFVVPLDAERSWYRYHHLFADVLRARLVAEQPDIVASLHSSASAWYAAHGFAADAVRHALAGGDIDSAARLIEQGLPQVRRSRQDGLMLAWVRALPEDVVRRNPALGIASAWSMMMAGDLAGMEARLDDAETALNAGARDAALAATWADTEDLRSAPATLWVYRAALAQARGDVRGTGHHARRALDLAIDEAHFVRGAAGCLLGLAEWAAGDVHEALPTFSQGLRSLHAAGNLVDELDSTMVLGGMWLTAGSPQEARRVYERALATATAHRPPYPRATADLHVGLAELDREAYDLAGAHAHLEAARLLGEHDSITEHRHHWFVVMAQVRAAAGDFGVAFHLLDEAEQLYRPGFYPDLRPIAAMRARVHIAAGVLDAVEAWARDRGVGLGDEVSFLREYDHLTLVRLVLARCAASAAAAESLDDVLGLLSRLDAAAESTRREGSMLEIGTLQALAHRAAGSREKALAALTRAVTRAPEPDSYVGLFLDEGAPMLALLRDAAASGDAVPQAVARRARHILNAADAGAPAGSGVTEDVSPGSAGGGGSWHASAETGPLADPLSDRELEVLRLLASDLTGPEIARRLFISINTLRTHTKRIFTKLDARNRSAAVRRGRQVGLL